MKLSRFFWPVAVFVLLGVYPAAVRALNVPTFDPGNNAPMPATVVQLFTDLATIPPGTAATDAQHQAIVADLDALAAGIFTPDPTAVDQLATDLGTAATDDLFLDNVVQYLADDFIGDPDDPESWMDDIQDDVASLINPPTGVDDPGDPTTLPIETSVGPLLDNVSGGVSNGSLDRFVVQLTAQGIPPYLLENYSGRVQLSVSDFLGVGPLPTLTLDTIGLPPSNPYTVSITRQSDGTSVVLGKFRVHSSFLRLAAPSVATPAAEIATFGHVTFGGIGTKKPLPADYDAADVATLTVTDAQGVVRLSGPIAAGQRVSEIKKSRLHLTGSPVVGGLAASANMVVRHKATPKKTSDRFRFMAKHLPVNAPVTLLADGVVVDHYVTTTHGRLFIIEGFEPQKFNRSGMVPPFNDLSSGTDLSGTKVFSLTNAQGNVLLSGSVAD